MVTGISGGLQERTRNESDTVSTTSKVLATPRNTLPKRKVLTIRNTSPNSADTITISFGDTGQAVSGEGVVLKQNESFVDATSEGYEAFQGQVNAICDTVNGTVSIFER